MSGVPYLIRRLVLASSAPFSSLGCRISPWRIAIAFVPCLATCCLPSSVRAQADITVDVTTGTDTVNALLFGHNVYFNNAMWDTRTNDLHSGAAPLVRSLAPWVLHFPGGSHSDLYFWEDALGLKTTAAVSAGTSSIGLADTPAWGTTATVRTLTADSLAANNETNPATVVLTAAIFSSAAATFSYTFPAHSLTMIELRAGSLATPPTAFISAAPLQGQGSPHCEV